MVSSKKKSKKIGGISHETGYHDSIEKLVGKDAFVDGIEVGGEITFLEFAKVVDETLTF